MRTFYLFMARRFPSTAWKFFWLRLVQAHLSKEIAASDKATHFNEISWD